MIDTEHRDAPICPHCGKENINVIYTHEERNSNCIEVECCYCQKPFLSTLQKTITFTTLPRNYGPTKQATKHDKSS